MYVDIKSLNLRRLWSSNAWQLVDSPCERSTTLSDDKSIQSLDYNAESSNAICAKATTSQCHECKRRHSAASPVSVQSLQTSSSRHTLWVSDLHIHIQNLALSATLLSIRVAALALTCRSSLTAFKVLASLSVSLLSGKDCTALLVQVRLASRCLFGDV